MTIVDIDKLYLVDNHIYYIKHYIGSIIFLSSSGCVSRHAIKFSLEYKPIGTPVVILDSLEFDCITKDLERLIEEKILFLDSAGILAQAQSVLR